MTTNSQRLGTARNPRTPTRTSLTTRATRHLLPSRCDVPCRECYGRGTVSVIRLPLFLWWVIGSVLLVGALLFGAWIGRT